jgi:hypothetical protein
MNEGDRSICIKPYWAVPLGAVCTLKKFKNKRILGAAKDEWTIECSIQLESSTLKVWLNWDAVKDSFTREE